VKLKIISVLLLVLLLLQSSCSSENTSDQSNPSDTASHVIEARGQENIAYLWCQVALTATARDTERFRPRPTVTSRMLALVFVSMFDAWTAFDENSIPVYAVTIPKRPTEEHTLANKEKAISFAAYIALSEYFYSDSSYLRSVMDSLSFNISELSQDITTAEGIGIKAARDVIVARKNDGSNQYGELSESAKPYDDYSQYSPINTVDKNVSVSHWQPKYFKNSDGSQFAPGCLTPFWGKVKPLALDSASEFRSPPPPALNSDQLKRELQEVIDLQANLSLEEKALVEFMRDGPQSVQQTGHWLIFAQDVSRRDQHTLDQDVKLYFLVTMAAMDAFIACWDTKMFYDFARPFSLIHDQYRDKKIQAWGGPHQGTVEMSGQNWIPYSPESFVCPPFPSYISGHSTVSGACSKVLELFTGDDYFGHTVRLLPGSMTELGLTQDSVDIDFPTFSETANLAGRSRVLGGYHIECENQEGLKMGRLIGEKVWLKYQYHVGQ
jgi:hypothetical protein